MNNTTAIEKILRWETDAYIDWGMISKTNPIFLSHTTVESIMVPSNTDKVIHINDGIVFVDKNEKIILGQYDAINSYANMIDAARTSIGQLTMSGKYGSNVLINNEIYDGTNKRVLFKPIFKRYMELSYFHIGDVQTWCAFDENNRLVLAEHPFGAQYYMKNVYRSNVRITNSNLNFPPNQYTVKIDYSDEWIEFNPSDGGNNNENTESNKECITTDCSYNS